MLVKEKYMDKYGEEKDFSFNSNVSLKQKMQIVSSVVESMIDENIYYSFMKSRYIDYFMIYYLTDIEFDQELIGDIDYIEEMTNINAAEIVKNNIDKNDLKSINDTINDNIQFRTGINKNDINDKISKLIDTVNNQIENVNLSELMTISENLFNLISDKDFNTETITRALINSGEIEKHVKEREKERKETNQNIIEMFKKKK